ncbi:hypothetical protein ABZ023_18655 [Streptomyces sp. NPDC006367]|uniref:hypothetical protein n=1 Tax=unclassified Streptomyces TaxID=2593676 RepID=UPI0033A9608F
MTSVGWLQENLHAVVDGFVANPDQAQPQIVTTEDGELAAVLMPLPLLVALLRAEHIDNADIVDLAGQRVAEAGEEGVSLEQLTRLVATHDPENAAELLRDLGHASEDRPG